MTRAQGRGAPPAPHTEQANKIHIPRFGSRDARAPQETSFRPRTRARKATPGGCGLDSKSPIKNGPSTHWVLGTT